MFSHNCDCDNHYQYEYNTAGKRNRHGFLGDYFSHFLRGFTMPLERSFYEKKRNLRKIMMAKFLGAAGLIFLFSGLAILINDLLQSGRWIGYVVVGLFLILIAMIKKNK
ncbi:MAG TPA: phage holin family protein [Patescibacteria group bacterium]|nr:phage holin family protein [Patescibacteria group bacterium]